MANLHETWKAIERLNARIDSIESRLEGITKEIGRQHREKSDRLDALSKRLDMFNDKIWDLEASIDKLDEAHKQGRIKVGPTTAWLVNDRRKAERRETSRRDDTDNPLGRRSEWSVGRREAADRRKG